MKLTSLNATDSHYCSALLAMLMMTVAFMLSKRPVLRIAVSLVLLLMLYYQFFKMLSPDMTL